MWGKCSPVYDNAGRLLAVIEVITMASPVRIKKLPRTISAGSRADPQGRRGLAAGAPLPVRSVPLAEGTASMPPPGGCL